MDYDYKEFAGLKKQNISVIEQFQKVFCPIGIFQFRYGGLYQTPDFKRWYFPLGNFTLVPEKEVGPELPESIDDIKRESHRLDMAIQTAESIRIGNSAKMIESLNALNFLVFGEESFGELLKVDLSEEQLLLNGLSVFMSTLQTIYSRFPQGIRPHFWDQYDLRKFQKKSNRGTWEDVTNKLLYNQPRNLLGQFWEQFILDFLIKKRTIGHCQRCGKVFASSQPKASYCPPSEPENPSGCAALMRSANQYERNKDQIKIERFLESLSEYVKCGHLTEENRRRIENTLKENDLAAAKELRTKLKIKTKKAGN